LGLLPLVILHIEGRHFQSWWGGNHTLRVEIVLRLSRARWCWSRFSRPKCSLRWQVKACLHTSAPGISSMRDLQCRRISAEHHETMRYGADMCLPPTRTYGVDLIFRRPASLSCKRSRRLEQRPTPLHELKFSSHAKADCGGVRPSRMWQESGTVHEHVLNFYRRVDTQAARGLQMFKFRDIGALS
jgi:hypothetical protein